MILRRQTLPVAILVLLGAMGGAVRADGPKKALKPGDPVVSIPLDDLGFEMAQPRLLLGGATMYTLSFVDNTHVLVTFNSHGLIPRDRDMTPQDEDRMVAALLVELPTGKVMARTMWHTRDREQYLWPLSHGMFLLRIKNKLTVLDPLRNLASGDAFREEKFLEMQRKVGYVTVSPGGDLLVIETVALPKRESDAVAAVAQAQANGAGLVLNTLSEPLTDVEFYRLIFNEETGKPIKLVAQSSGHVLAHSLVRVPATAEGFLDITKESAATWLFDFQSHAGKRVELSPFDTGCAPSPYFVSRSEFVAIGCAGGQAPLSEFNLRGEEPWIQMLPGPPIVPLIASAPDAGRFVFSHLILAGSFYDLQNLEPEEVIAQEIMALQTHDGRVLLKLRISPVPRMGQNFDLSPDGLSLTVIRSGNLEVYKLPALTAKDQEQVKLAQKDIPEKTDARIRLTPIRPGQSGAEVATQTVETPAPATPPAAAQAGSGGLDLGGVTGKAVAPAPSVPAEVVETPPAPAEVDVPRKPPSLYGPDYPKPKKPD